MRVFLGVSLAWEHWDGSSGRRSSRGLADLDFGGGWLLDAPEAGVVAKIRSVRCELANCEHFELGCPSNTSLWVLYKRAFLPLCQGGIACATRPVLPPTKCELNLLSPFGASGSLSERR